MFENTSLGNAKSSIPMSMNFFMIMIQVYRMPGSLAFHPLVKSCSTLANAINAGCASSSTSALRAISFICSKDSISSFTAIWAALCFLKRATDCIRILLRALENSGWSIVYRPTVWLTKFYGKYLKLVAMVNRSWVWVKTSLIFRLKY